MTPPNPFKNPSGSASDQPTGIVAVRPARGRIIHLHQAGYQPGEKPRPHADQSAMCGAAIWPNGTPPRQYVPVPLAEALDWTSLVPNPLDPRPTWAWCRPCIGHAVTALGLVRASLLAVVRTAENAPDDDPPRCSAHVLADIEAARGDG